MGSGQLCGVAASRPSHLVHLSCLLISLVLYEYPVSRTQARAHVFGARFREQRGTCTARANRARCSRAPRATPRKLHMWAIVPSRMKEYRSLLAAESELSELCCGALSPRQLEPRLITATSATSWPEDVRLSRGSHSACPSARVNVRACCEGALISSSCDGSRAGEHAKWNIRSHLGASTRLNGATCWP